MNENEIFNKKVETIVKMVEEAHRTLDKITSMLDGLTKEVKRDAYRNVEGIIGIFDGSYLVDSQNNKYEVPANYSAKSRLVYGDTIKMVEDEGKTIFKQIQKVERKATEGVLSKKEGKWYILTDSGSYKISDIAADFNHAELNDEAIAFLPAQNLNAPYATLDKILKKEPVANTTVEKKPIQQAVSVAPKKPVTLAPKQPVNMTKQSTAAPRTVTPSTAPTPYQKPVSSIPASQIAPPTPVTIQPAPTQEMVVPLPASPIKTETTTIENTGTLMDVKPQTKKPATDDDDDLR
jgi:hypothetical protein